MATLINGFAKKARTFSEKEVSYAEALLMEFLSKFEQFSRDLFSVTDRTRFNIAFFEAVFRAFCEKAFAEKSLKLPAVIADTFKKLKTDADFVKATRLSTGQTSNVKSRFEKAKEYLLT